MLDVVVFEDSDVLAEFGGVSVFSVAEWKHRKTQKLHRTQQAHLDPQRQQHQALSFISWHILSSHLPYNSSSKGCNLCLKEKFLIICRPDLSTLNKSIMNSCLPAATETKLPYATTKLLNFALHKLDYIVDKRW